MPKDRAFDHPVSSEITPRQVVLDRRQLMRGAAALAAMTALPLRAQPARPGKLAPLPAAKTLLAGAQTMDKPTPYADATSYNNFYEFGTDKADPARAAGTLKTRPWTVVVEGEVRKPGTWDIEALLKLSAMEERVYRLRCV